MSSVAILPFVAPGLFLAGAACVAIPIVIHLLNKRRFKTVTWAAMDFLMAAQRRNARKLKFRRWLLLATRCLALLMLAAALAQFVLSNTAIGNMLGAQDRVTAIVWDDSYSMGYQGGPAGGGGTFEKSRQAILDYLAAAPKGERIALILAGRAEESVAPRPTLDHDLLRRLVTGQQVSDAGTDLPGALTKAADALKDFQTAAGAREVLLLTDASRSSVGGLTNTEGVKKAMERVKAVATRVRVADCGVDGQENVGITALSPTRPVVAANHEIRFSVTVTNGSPRAQAGVPVTLLMDGRVVHEEKIPTLEPGESKTVVMQPDAAVANPGNYTVEARVPRDLVPADDVRRLVLPVLKELPILIVDGAPGDSQTLGSAAFLTAAYAPVIEGKSDSPFSPHVIMDMDLPRTPLKDYAAVILSDVGVPDTGAVESLKSYVRAGGCLMIFPGQRTANAAAAFNAKMGAGAGEGLLPATLGPLIKLEGVNAADTSREVRFLTAGVSNAVVAPFAEDNNLGLASPSTNTYIELKVPSADGGTQTILSYTNHAPAFVSKHVGAGTVILAASSADTAWTNFPAKPAYVPFVQELLYSGLSRQGAGLTLAVADRLNLPADLAVAGAWHGPANKIVNVSGVVQDGRSVLTSDPLRAAGLYTPPGGNVAVAVNPDADEADVRHLPAGAFAGALGLSPNQITDQLDTIGNGHASADGQFADLTPGGAIGWWLIPVALLLFLLESLFARAFSVYR